MTKKEMLEKIQELNKDSLNKMGYEKYSRIQSVYTREFGLKYIFPFKSYKKDLIEKYLTVALIVNDHAQ